jgi:hypothetical protein
LPRRLAARLAALVCALAMIGAMARSGALFYCEGMGRVAEAPCCDTHHADDQGQPAIDWDDDTCCVRWDAPRVPQGSAVDELRVPAAPLAALLPAPSPSLLLAPRVLALSRSPLARSGAPPPTASEACALRMVFLS